MDMLLIFAAWYLSGIAGSVLILEFNFRRGGLDIDIGCLVFGLATAFLGPLNLVVGGIFGVGILLSRWVDMDRVVFRSRRD